MLDVVLPLGHGSFTPKQRLEVFIMIINVDRFQASIDPKSPILRKGQKAIPTNESLKQTTPKATYNAI